MEIVVLPSPEAACLRAARIIADLVADKPDAVLGLPAGNTPGPVYAELVRLHRTQGLSFARSRSFNLDEYLDLAPDHSRSFFHEITEAFIRQVDLPLAQAHAPDARAADPVAAAAGYEAAIVAAGGLDLVLLGLGTNGHIAFNEPGSAFDSRTRVVTLRGETRVANRRRFGVEPVPLRAITMGIATILEARRCVLLAYGGSKAEAIARAFQDSASPRLPASALQDHPDAVVLVDGAAASRLTVTTR